MKSPRPSPSLLRRAALVGAGVAAWWLGPARADAALTSPHYVAVYRPLITIKCPSIPWLRARPKDLGYLPAVGPNELRWQEPPPPARTTPRAAAMLYDPPAEKPPGETPPAVAPVTPSRPNETESKPAAATTPPAPTNQGGSPLRAEDFLPFFEKPADLSADRVSDGDVTPFVPARPVQAPSKAIFLQK